MKNWKIVRYAVEHPWRFGVKTVLTLAILVVGFNLPTWISSNHAATSAGSSDNSLCEKLGDLTAEDLKAAGVAAENPTTFGGNEKKGVRKFR